MFPPVAPVSPPVAPSPVAPVFPPVAPSPVAPVFPPVAPSPVAPVFPPVAPSPPPGVTVGLPSKISFRLYELSLSLPQADSIIAVTSSTLAFKGVFKEFNDDLLTLE